MKVIINGKEESFDEGVTIKDILNIRGLAPESVIIEYNKDIVERDRWGQIRLKENDAVELLRFVGGG